MAHFTIHPEGAEPFTAQLKGRELWALEQLIHAGSTGCTPITEPAPRWSAYIHLLRKRGIPIETRHEAHGGPYPGNHARYVLKANAVRRAEA
ncbi:hypothetical protein Q9295_01735 [Xinfangfangia sp. CPCC 101601]|uniref:Winged helix domain-containing protein n=1 Tax=Pseudogemmobacter lacusdianii TaxID=3069608 RepID=A0ABU0VTP0_9RHOB|nr:hypothetical protein [Xinfangfangia sp. CPCC 101601]MDQ2065079.1 hypothetical protein [Xinfangfangia sp. CPCC 101601]